MAGWLNEPVLIIEGSRIYRETQSYSAPGGAAYRTRKVIMTNERYIGGNKAAADAKASELDDSENYSDISVSPAGGGQHHVVATLKTTGAWCDWIVGFAPTE